MPTEQSQFLRALENFESIQDEDKNVLSESLFTLSQTACYESLGDFLFSLQDGIIIRSIQKETLEVIIKYLGVKLRSPDPSQALFIFSAENLEKINPVATKLQELFQHDAAKAEVLCNAIYENLQLSWCNSLDFDLLIHLDLRFLQDQAALDFLNNNHSNNLESIRAIITILNALLTDLPNYSITQIINLLSPEKVKRYKDTLDKLQKLGLPSQTLFGYEIITEFHPDWFDINYLEKSRELWAELPALLICPKSFKYVLKYLSPHVLTRENVDILSSILNLFIQSDTEQEWINLQRYFNTQNDFEKLFCRLRKMIEVINLDLAVATKKVLTNCLREANLFLLLEDSFFNKEDFIEQFLLMKDLNQKIYLSDGLVILKRIQKLNIKFSEDYVAILNKITIKPQLEYISTLDYLSNAWFTLEGLRKLDNFGSKYFSPEGLKFIAKFDVNTITPEHIKKINECDHTTLQKSFENVSMEQFDTFSLAIRLKRVNLIHSFVKTLREKNILSKSAYKNSEECILQERKDVNAKELAKGECVITNKQLISETQQDESVFHVESTRTAPLRYEELNDALGLIQTEGESDVFCERAVFKRVLNSGAYHLHKDRKFIESDLVNLTEQNINLSIVNQYFGLATMNSDEATINQQISFLEDLMLSSHLNTLPEAFFINEDLTLLSQLDRRYFLNNRVDAIHDTQSIEYLNLCIGQQTNQEAVTKLNSIMQSGLFPVFSSDTFSLVPLEWICDRQILRFLQSHSDFISTQNLQKGFLGFACENFNFGIDIFKYNIGYVFSYADLGILLKAHSSRSHFNTLVQSASSYITVEFCKKLECDLLSKTLYHIECYSQQDCDHLLSNAATKILRQKMRQSLLDNFNIQVVRDCIKLKKLNKICEDAVNALSLQLDKFARNRFIGDKVGNVTSKWWTFTKPKEVAAYQLLHKALKAVNVVQAVKEVISNNSDSIGFHKISFFAGLHTFTQQFMHELDKGYIFHFLPLLNELLNKKDTNKFIYYMLDDCFLSLLTYAGASSLAVIFPEEFFTILTSFQPDLLESYFTYEKQRGWQSSKGSLTQQYYAFKTPHEEKTKTQSHKLIFKADQFYIPPFAKKDASKPKRISENENQLKYQLIDTDVNVGLMILRETCLSEEILYESLRKKIHTRQSIHFACNEDSLAMQDFIFLSIGPIDQNHKVNSTHTLTNIQESTLSNRGKICFGIFNVNGVHYFSAFVYTSQKGNTQILILDPSYKTKDKINTVNKIKSLFIKQFKGKCTCNVIDVIQQFNDSDCGIACLQTGLDAIQRRAIRLRGDKLECDRTKLTLDGERYIGKEEAFVTLAHRIRNEWEARLDARAENYYYLDGVKVPAGSYSFKENKYFQTLETQSILQLDTLLNHFHDANNSALLNIFGKGNELDETLEPIRKLIDHFLEGNKLCAEFLDLVHQMKEYANRCESNYESALLNYSLETVQSKLFESVVSLYNDTTSQHKKLLACSKTKSKFDEEEENQHMQPVKLKILSALDEILKNLQLYPEKPQRPLLKKWHTSQHRILELSKNCLLWRNEFVNESDFQKINDQRYFVANEIFEIFRRCTNWRGQLMWDSVSLGNLIKLPLARLVGVNEKLLTSLDFSKTYHLRVQDYYGERTGQTYVEPMSADEYLYYLIENHLYELKNKTFKGRDFTTQEIFYSMSRGISYT